ncbi:ATPase, partial [Micromonospora sp. NPDC047074]
APPSVDVAAFRLMGLAVVSRLASRYAIRVELRRNVEGGTVAQVTLPASTVVLPPVHSRDQQITRPRQPLAVEQAPFAPAGRGEPTVGAGRTASATLTEQWRSAAPAPWQAPEQARDTTAPVQAGGLAGTHPAAPAQPAFTSGGFSAGGPTVAYPTVDPLPKRVPGGEATAGTSALPVGPVAGAPAITGLSAGLPGARGAGFGTDPNAGRGLGAGLAATAPAAPAAPITPRPELPAEAPIFREMEAVWFRSHGNEATAIFTRPDFSQSAQQTGGTPAAGTPTPAPQAAARGPKLPTRTPGSTATPPPAQSAPSSYGPPATPPTTPPAAPVAEPPPAAAPIDPSAWRTAADEGWSRASQAAEPAAAGTTRSGLPKRVPQAQLVPGGIEPRAGRDRSRRTPDEVRGLLSAYHRGVQRGRSAGTDQNSTSTKETSR